MFSYKYCEIFKNSFFIEHLWWTDELMDSPSELMALKDFFYTCMLYCRISSGLCRCLLSVKYWRRKDESDNPNPFLGISLLWNFWRIHDRSWVFFTFSINLQLISDTCFFFIFLKNKIKNNQKKYYFDSGIQFYHKQNNE